MVLVQQTIMKVKPFVFVSFTATYLLS